MVTGLRRGRPAELPLTATQPGVTLTASRRSVERLVDAAARSIPGVTSARVSTGRRGVRVDAVTRSSQAGDLRDRVEAAVRERLDSLQLSTPLRLTLRIRTRENT
jgi:hypothetical protein